MAFSQLPRLLLTEEDPTPSPFPSPPFYSKASFRPSIAVIIAVLTTMFSLTCLLLLYAKHCKRQSISNSSSSGAYGAGVGPNALDRRNSGVVRSVVQSLPVFRFASLTGPHRHGLECAVCLTRFEPTEILRLLPKCKHGFHVECVDIWLEAHSTCPLCRVRVDPEDVLLVFDPIPEPPPPEPITVSEAVVSLPFVRRISGRHSSAGERNAGLVQVLVQRRSEGGDGPAAAAPVSVRKDQMLLTESTSVVERVEFERRYSHRINVVSGCDGTPRGERWSDLKLSDILHLRSERIITADSGRGVNNLRSVSEITGMSRFREGTKWLGLKAKSTGWGQRNGPNT